MIADIDIVKDNYRLLSFDLKANNTIPMQGKFQQEIRGLANRFMDEEARRIYLGNLDYNYMIRKLLEDESYSFMMEMRDQQGNLQVLSLIHI